MDSRIPQELIRRSAAGDRRAQHELFSACRGTVMAIVWRSLGPVDRDDLQDVIQHAYIELFRSLRLYRGECSFDTWLHRICVRASMMYLRKRYRRRMVPFVKVPANVLEAVADDSADPARLAEDGRLREAIARALAGLSPPRRVALVLHEIEGRGVAEIARIMECSEGTVKSRLARARAAMEKSLGRGTAGYVSEKMPAAGAVIGATPAAAVADKQDLL